MQGEVTLTEMGKMFSANFRTDKNLNACTQNKYTEAAAIVTKRDPISNSEIYNTQIPWPFQCSLLFIFPLFSINGYIMARPLQIP